MQPFNSERYGSPNLGMPPFAVAVFCLWEIHVCSCHSVSSCAYAASSIQKIWVCFLLLGRPTPLDQDSNFTADATAGFFLLLLSGCGSLMKALRLFPGWKELEDAHKILNAMNIHLPLCFSRSYACDIMLNIWIKLNVKRSLYIFSILIIQLIFSSIIYTFIFYLLVVGICGPSSKILSIYRGAPFSRPLCLNMEYWVSPQNPALVGL